MRVDSVLSCNVAVPPKLGSSLPHTSGPRGHLHPQPQKTWLAIPIASLEGAAPARPGRLGTHATPRPCDPKGPRLWGLRSQIAGLRALSCHFPACGIPRPVPGASPHGATESPPTKFHAGVTGPMGPTADGTSHSWPRWSSRGLCDGDPHCSSEQSLTWGLSLDPSSSALIRSAASGKSVGAMGRMEFHSTNTTGWSAKVSLEGR